MLSYHYVFIILILLVNIIQQYSNAAHSRRSFVSRSSNGNANNKYDRSITTFNPNGQLLQVEYSIEASKRCSDNVNVVCLITNTSIYLSIMKNKNIQNNNNIIHRVTNDIFLITNGLIGDIKYIINNVRILCQQHYINYGENITINEIKNYIASLQHELTKTSGIRPLGCTIIIIGFDYIKDDNNNNDDESSNNRIPYLYRIYPGGIVENCYYCCLGKYNDNIMNILNEKYNDIYSLQSSSLSNNSDNDNNNHQYKNEDNVSIITNLINIMNEGTNNNNINDNTDEIKSLQDIWIFQPKNNNYNDNNIDIKCLMNIDNTNESIETIKQYFDTTTNTSTKNNDDDNNSNQKQ